jgi:hypothetical protein
MNISIRFYLVITLTIFMLGCSRNELGNGYQYIASRVDDTYIVSGNEIIVGPTIVDIVSDGRVAVGITLGVEKLACDGGYKIKLNDSVNYFILNMEEGNFREFKNKESFLLEVESLEGVNAAEIDFSKPDEIFDKYSEYYTRIDYSGCRPVD